MFGEDFYFHTKAMPSRISGACNACRAKKQKVKDPLRRTDYRLTTPQCSGDRSGCAQCRAADQQCTWPAQRKRQAFSIANALVQYANSLRIVDLQKDT